MPNPAALAKVPLLYESVFGVSSEVSIRVVEPELGPWLVTLTVKDQITGKPVTEAKIVADTGEQATTDATGTATLTLTGGQRTLTITHPNYLTKNYAFLLTKDETIELKLFPLWTIGLGIVSGGIALTLIVTKALKQW